jgi:hypothetical protein
MKQHELNTTNWNTFEFEVDGIPFLSKIAPKSPFMEKIKALPAGVFISMNKSAVIDLVGQGLTRNEIAEQLYRINENASHAVLEVVL